MASLSVHPLLPVASLCFQIMLTKRFLQQHKIRWGVWICKMPSFLKKKKKLKGFFLKPFSWRVSQPFPTNSCPGKAAGALFCSLETRRRAGDGTKQQYLRPLPPLGTRHCRAAALHSASSLAQTYSGTLESYLALLHLSASIPYTVKWNHQWLHNVVKIWAAHEAFSVNVCRISYVAHA